jgi:hypothetical protein
LQGGKMGMSTQDENASDFGGLTIKWYFENDKLNMIFYGWHSHQPVVNWFFQP